MKCPNDQTDMELGQIRGGSLWFKGRIPTFLFWLSGGIVVHAWKCPKCGKIELTTEQKS